MTTCPKNKKLSNQPISEKPTTLFHKTFDQNKNAVFQGVKQQLNFIRSDAFDKRKKTTPTKWKN